LGRKKGTIWQQCGEGETRIQCPSRSTGSRILVERAQTDAKDEKPSPVMPMKERF